MVGLIQHGSDYSHSILAHEAVCKSELCTVANVACATESDHSKLCTLTAYYGDAVLLCEHETRLQVRLLQTR